LLARLTGIDAEHDAEVIRGFCAAFDISAHHVVARIRTHLHRSAALN